MTAYLAALKKAQKKTGKDAELDADLKGPLFRLHYFSDISESQWSASHCRISACLHSFQLPVLTASLQDRNTHTWPRAPLDVHPVRCPADATLQASGQTLAGHPEMIQRFQRVEALPSPCGAQPAHLHCRGWERHRLATPGAARPAPSLASLASRNVASLLLFAEERG